MQRRVVKAEKRSCKVDGKCDHPCEADQTSFIERVNYKVTYQFVVLLIAL